MEQEKQLFNQAAWLTSSMARQTYLRDIDIDTKLIQVTLSNLRKKVWYSVVKIWILKSTEKEWKFANFQSLAISSLLNIIQNSRADQIDHLLCS